MTMIDVNGSAIHYVEKGSGFPLVLLHAFPVDLRVWKNQLDELSGTCRVITPDFRGFGKSPLAGPFTIASMARDIHTLLTNINALPCIIGGISMGGYVALNFARQFAVDLRGLILVDTQDLSDTPEARENRNRMIEIARSKGSASIADLMIGKMLSPDTVKHRPEQIKMLRAMMEACPPATIEQALVALRDRPAMTDELPNIKVPALAVVGEADPITPPAVMEAMKERLADAELAVILGAGHMSPLEQPTQVSRVIQRFANRLK